MSVPELRPLGVGEILDVALKIWRRHFVTLAKVVLVIVAPVEILSSLLITSLAPEEAFTFEDDFGTTDTTFGPFADPAFDGGDAAAFFAGALLAGVLSGLGFLLSSGASLRAVSVAYLGGRPDWRESLQLVVSRLGSFIWLGILMGAGLMLAMLFFVFPFFWLSVAWSLAFVVLVAEGRGGAGALGRSRQLVRGRWWPIFGTLLLAFILQAIVEQIISIPLFFLSFGEPGTVAAFLGLALTSIISSVITTPFVAAVFVLLYFDQRVRKEGFDVELLTHAIAPAGPGGTGWPAPGSDATDRPEWGRPPADWDQPRSSDQPRASWDQPPPAWDQPEASRDAPPSWARPPAEPPTEPSPPPPTAPSDWPPPDEPGR